MCGFPNDAEKIVFITDNGAFCYKVISFGLKIVGATYQRLITGIFKGLIRTIVEIYIDDVVVKSRTL